MAVQRVTATEAAEHRRSFRPHPVPRPRLVAAAAACAIVCLLSVAACSSGGGHVQTAGGQGADPETVDFPIF